MNDHVGHFQLSNERMTFRVHARNGIVLDTAPIARRFIGQPLDNLASWMRKMGPTDVHLLESHGNDAPEHLN